MKQASRALAVLKLSPRVKNLITFAQSVATAMTSNASFPSPVPTLATFEADITALVTAETAVLARTKGTAQDRNAKLVVVKGDLERLKASCRGSPTPPIPATPRRSS